MSASRVVRPRRLLAALAIGCCAMLAVPGTAGAATPGAASSGSSGGTDGWWYDAMSLGSVHRHYTGKGVTIGLIDMSLDHRVPDLQGADIKLRTTCDGQPAFYFPQSHTDHGDAMASLLVGTGHGDGPGGSGIVGVAPDAKVLFYQMDTHAEGAGKPAVADCDAIGVASAVNDAVRDGVDIISLSSTVADADVLKRAVRNADRHGVVVVAATGDTTTPGAVYHGFGFPAGDPGVVGVNAADRNARPWTGNPPPTFDAFQKMFPVITAPGVDVRSARHVPGQGWTSLHSATGTSSATAIVSGSLALVKQKYPRATGRQLVQDLIHYTGGSAKYGWDRRYGFGIVSIPDMLAHDPTKWPDVNPLLAGPKVALKRYPMSSYGHAPAGTATGAAAGAAKASATPGSSAAAGASHHDAAGRSDASSGGVPTGVWAAAGAVVVLLLVAAGAAAVRRTGRTSLHDAHAGKG